MCTFFSIGNWIKCYFPISIICFCLNWILVSHFLQFKCEFFIFELATTQFLLNLKLSSNFFVFLISNCFPVNFIGTKIIWSYFDFFLRELIAFWCFDFLNSVVIFQQLRNRDIPACISLIFTNYLTISITCYLKSSTS
ncbi:hypothetical protein D8895_13665 [Streptococcus sp. BCA20]|nr:hypothetical protein D8895_13665 [Streptococcus sp. BCA20]